MIQEPYHAPYTKDISQILARADAEAPEIRLLYVVPLGLLQGGGIRADLGWQFGDISIIFRTNSPTTLTKG
jgi:hypothetical protein